MSGRQTREPIDYAAIDSRYADALRGDSAALSELATLCKTKAVRAIVADKPNRGQLCALLSDANPKTRKNAARLLGAIGQVRDVMALVDALANETTLYVIPSLLLAIGVTAQDAVEDVRSRAVDAIHNALAEADKLTAENEITHRDSIRQAANNALSALEMQTVEMVRPLPPCDVHLRAAKGCGAVLRDEARAAKLAPHKIAGDTLQYHNVEPASLQVLRCFAEALIPIGSIPMPPSADAGKTALHAWAAESATALLPFATLLTAHYALAPVPYRIELRDLPHQQRASCVHALAARLDASGAIRNAPSSYIAECRLEPQGDQLCAYVKCSLPPDARFAYRKESLPASIHPVIAASLIRFAQPFCKPNARVLDPCCGVGTLLIERALRNPVAACVGVDIATAAVTAARKNMKAAAALHPALSGVCTAIAGDLRRFAPKAPFDELYANLPFGVRVGTHDANVALYATLFQQLDTWMTADATVVLYTTQRAAVLRLAARSGWTLAKEIRFDAGGLAPWGMVLRRK